MNWLRTVLSISCLVSTVAAQDANKDLIEILQTTVAKIHAASDVPGLSVAVIRDRKILWAEGYGSKRSAATAKSDQVDAKTLFQAASISKPITAMAAMCLIATGDLQLDEPVEDYLGDWSLDYAEEAADDLVILRQLLSHTGGTTVHGFPGYPRNANMPDLVTVLEGDGNTARIEVDFRPGTRFRYSGGGYCLVQHMMIESQGASFPEIMQKEVLGPLGMTSSSYEQPLPESRWAETASAHNMEGKPFEVAWNNYPEMAAAGLWTTPTDLARAMLAMDAARRGEEGALFPREMAIEMLSRQPNAAECGLGWRIGSSDFRHGGSNRGFKCDARYQYEAGIGIVVMINSDRSQILDEVRQALIGILKPR